MPSNRQTFFGNDVPVTVADGALLTQNANEANNRSAFGELLVAQITPRAAWRFDYGTSPNTRLYSAVTANGGGTAIANSLITLSTSANTAGSASISTLRRLRYLPGMGGLVRFTAVFDNPTNGANQLIGLGDSQDGFFFGYKGNAFGVILRRAGNDTFIGASDWNGDKIRMSPQLGNVYQIRYQWLGFGFIRFYIEDPESPNRGFALVHTIYYPNTTTLTSILNPTLPIFALVENLGNNTNVQLKTPSAMAALEGITSNPFNPLDVANAFDASATFANTSNNHLLTIRNKSTFGGASNRVPIEITGINIARSASGANTSNVRVYRNATTAGARSYTDIDTNNSPVDESTTTTTITSASPEYAYVITANITLQAIEYPDNQFVLQPGESMSIGIQDGGVQSTDFVVTVNWIEKF